MSSYPSLSSSSSWQESCSTLFFPSSRPRLIVLNLHNNLIRWLTHISIYMFILHHCKLPSAIGVRGTTANRPNFLNKSRYTGASSSSLCLVLVCPKSTPAKTQSMDTSTTSSVTTSYELTACTLNGAQANELASDSLVWCSQHGLVMGVASDNSDSMVNRKATVYTCTR